MQQAQTRLVKVAEREKGFGNIGNIQNHSVKYHVDIHTQSYQMGKLLVNMMNEIPYRSDTLVHCSNFSVCMSCILHSGLVWTLRAILCLAKSLCIFCHLCVHHSVLLYLPALLWLLYIPLCALAWAKVCVRAGSLRPQGTCYSFSLVFISSPLCSVVYTPPLLFSLFSLLSFYLPFVSKFFCCSLKQSVFV